MRTARLIVFLCAAAMVILGIYSFINNDNISGIAWTFLGVLFFILGYIRVK